MIVSSHFNRALQSSSRFNFSGKKRIHPVLSPRWPSDYAMRGAGGGGGGGSRVFIRGDESGTASIRDGDPGSLTLFNRGKPSPGKQRRVWRRQTLESARVATAIPAFSFYAEKRERKNKSRNNQIQCIDKMPNIILLQIQKLIYYVY